MRLDIKSHEEEGKTNHYSFEAYYLQQVTYKGAEEKIHLISA